MLTLRCMYMLHISFGINNIFANFKKKTIILYFIEGLYLPQDFPGGSDSKESTYNAGDLDSIPGLGRAPGGGHDNPLQYSSLENPHGQGSLVGSCCKELDMAEQLSTHIYLQGFPSVSAVKNPPANARDTKDMGLSPGLGRSAGEENGNPLQYSCLGNPQTEKLGGLKSIGLLRVRHN